MFLTRDNPQMQCRESDLKIAEMRGGDHFLSEFADHADVRGGRLPPTFVMLRSQPAVEPAKDITDYVGLWASCSMDFLYASRDFFLNLFRTDFPARWNCGEVWANEPWVGWMHILSDLGIWTAYFAIPVALAFFILRKSDLPFRRIFFLFVAFILLCGLTHLVDALIFYWPVYRAAGLLKAVTAVVSWSTVFALLRITPQVLTMRSPEALQREIAARSAAEGELQRVNAELEQRVNERTQELSKAVADLAAERELLRTTLRSIGDGVIITDTQGRIAFLNEVAEGLTGWRGAEALEKSLAGVFHIVHEDTRKPLDNPAVAALIEGSGIRRASQTLLIAKDGAERVIDQSAAPIRGVRGKTVGSVIVFRDITERRLLELQLRKTAADVAQSDRRKSEFLAVLAHELRNPLAPIRNALSIVRISEGDPHAVRDATAVMERQIGQMVRLVDDLLDVSRISEGKIELRPDRVELKATIDQAVETSRPLLETAKQELVVHAPPTPIWLKADAVRLAQVFSNLINNACKYSEPGGRIELTAELKNDQATIRVKDSGVGIPQHMLPQIFEMFTQVDQSLERAQGGLGIGLTLVKRLVEMHGGSVSAASEGPGRGSEFIVRLPALESSLPAPRPTTTSPPPASAPAEKRKILVVDDNRDAAVTLAMLLKVTGNETKLAHDGLAAIEAAEAFQPDVIILDIGLPKLNGYDAAKRIREQTWGREMVLIALTGWGQEEDRRRSREAGFNHHLVKPVDHAALVQLINAPAPAVN